MTPLERLAAKPPGQRRACAVLLLVGALVFLWAAILTPLGWIVHSQEEWRAEVRRELAHALGRAASEPELRTRVATISMEPIWGRFYEVPAHQDAAALIQRDVLSVGTAAGVSVQAVAPLPAVEEVGLEAHGVRFTASLTADQLKQFMNALRSNAHYLRVERLTVTSPQVQRTDQNSALNVTMEVYGFTRSVDTADSPLKASS